MNFKYTLLSLISISLLTISCDELLQNNSNNTINNNEKTIKHNNNIKKEYTNNGKGPDTPARKNFSDKDLSYQGQSIKLTKHGRCRMECRKLDAFEIQEVIDQGKVNEKKSNPNSKPCPTVAFEGLTADGQTARVVVGTCEGNYKIVTVIDLKNDWKCDCE